MTRQLCLVRHGPPARTDLCYGWTDVALAEPPEQTALTLQGQVPAWALNPETPSVSSPSLRCSKLAEALAMGRTVQVEPRLREVHFGAWEGQPWSDISRLAIDDWARDPFGFQFPEGESVPDFIERCRSALHDLPEQTLVITHAGVIRTFLHLCHQLPLAEAYARRVPFGSVQWLSHGPS